MRACDLPASLLGTQPKPERQLPGHVPEQGRGQGQGRLVVIARNPKDAIVSAHFFSQSLAAKGAAMASLNADADAATDDSVQSNKPRSILYC
jgi:hypothetical protein